MTDIFNEVTAAISNRNTTANAIIWTNANKPLVVIWKKLEY